MVATQLLISLAGYLLYAICMFALTILVGDAFFATFPSLKEKLPWYIEFSIIQGVCFALKNFRWVVLISESHYTLPSSVSQVIAILICIASYLVCMMPLPVLLINTCTLVWSAAVRQHCDVKKLPDWVNIIWLVVNFVVTDRVAGYYVDPAIISRFLSYFMFLAGYLVYITCMLALSALVLFIAGTAIENSKSWWPELIHTSIVGVAFLLLNMMWGSPFQKPSADSDTRAALFGLGGYLAYILCSMVLSYNLFGASLLPRTFTIGLTFTLFDVFVKPSSYSNMVATLGTITTALMAFLVLAAMSFLVFMFLQTWVDMLLPSAWRHHPARTFATIISLTFMAMKAMLVVVVQAVNEPSVFSGMKAGLLGIIDMINGYHGAYAGIRNLTVLAVLLLSMESMRVVSMYRLYTKAALIVALGLVLTMLPGLTTDEPAFMLVSDDFVQQTINSFVTSQIQITDGGGTEQLNN